MLIKKIIASLLIVILVENIPAETFEFKRQKYIENAVKNNSRLRSIYNQWQAEKERIDGSFKLPNTRLNFGYFAKNIETAVGPQEYKIGLFQKLPWFGKLSTTRKIQIHQAEMAFLNYQQAIDEIIYQIDNGLYRIALNRRQLQLTQESLNLTKQWLELVTAKYQNSSKSYADVIKVRQEIARQKEKIASLDRKYNQLLASFKKILEVDTLGQINISHRWQLEKVDINKFQDLTIGKNPKLQLLEVREQIAGLLKKRASQEFIPDAGVGVDYILTGDKYQADGSKVSESGKNPLVFMLALELPLQWGKIMKNITASDYQQQSARDREEALRNELQTEMVNLILDLEDWAGKYKMYTEQLIPLTKESLNIRTAELKTSKTDIYKLIEDQQDLLTYQLKQANAVTNFYITKAKIKQLTGSTL